VKFDDHKATWSFDPANAYCARQLRDEYVSILYACATPASDFFAAELIYGEFISNAIRHAPGNVHVELQWSYRHPVLSVQDQQDLFLWAGDLPHDPLHEHGRGLYIVKSLALSLRIKGRLGAGYKVSAVLPVERRRDLADLFAFPDSTS
jgi:hypothetical protein